MQRFDVLMPPEIARKAARVGVQKTRLHWMSLAPDWSAPSIGSSICGPSASAASRHDKRRFIDGPGDKDCEEAGMKVRLRIQRDSAVLYDGVHDVSDADSFGGACADAWKHMLERKLAKASSVGALFDALDERLLDDLYGAEISLSSA